MPWKHQIVWFAKDCTSLRIQIVYVVLDVYYIVSNLYTILYIPEVVTNFISYTYNIKWVTTSSTHSIQYRKNKVRKKGLIYFVLSQNTMRTYDVKQEAWSV